LRIGVVGAGFWTPYQIFGWNEVEGVEVVAIANRTVPRAEAIARQFGIPSVFDDPAEMLDQAGLDCLDVISGLAGHPSAVHLAAQKRVPVICQKPMATSFEEANAMVKACKEADVPFLVNENWRYQAPIRETAALLARGEIGEPFRARIQFSCSFPVFENQPAMRDLPQFILTDIGSHVLDVARFLFGDAKDLVCRTSRIAENISGEDVATVMMTMDRCPVVICEMSYASRLREEAFPETYLTIEGSKGSIELAKGRHIYVTTQTGTTDTKVAPHFYPWADPAYDLVHASIVDCNRALAAELMGTGKAETTADDNLRTVALVFAGYRSAETGQRIEFGEWGAQ
jgi:predicted dehydrogenase